MNILLFVLSSIWRILNNKSTSQRRQESHEHKENRYLSPSNAKTIARDVRQEIEAGYEVILQFDQNVDPNRVLKTINLCVDDKKVDITIRHAEFREYVENAARGATLERPLPPLAIFLLRLGLVTR